MKRIPDDVCEELAALRAENERLLELVTVACEFILATPPFGPVWKERRNAILDEASALGMWKRPDVPRAALAALDEGERCITSA